MNILVGFAPLKPAEFVVLKIQQVGGDIRSDPYKTFKVRVKWDGRYVAGFSKVSALAGSTNIVDHREGGDPGTRLKMTGGNKHEAVTLERGVTHDKDFEQWANQVALRKDIILEVYNEAGQVATAYAVFRCWVSEFVPLPDLDANANALAIQRLKLENEGLLRMS